MVIKRERLKIPVPRAAEMHIWEEVRQDFPGLIHDVKAGFWNALSLGFKESGERIAGEVFFPTRDSVLYYRVDPNRQYIEAGCLMPDGDGTQTFQGFCERIQEAVWPGKRDAQSLTWSPCEPTDNSFELVCEEGHRSSPGPQHYEAARALADNGRRGLLSTIHSNRNVLLENLASSERSLMEVGQEVHLLESLGLVQKDFVVFCREQGNQISRVQSFTEIEEATRRGFKCFSCGRPMAEERIDQLLSCTSVGNMLARPNYWLTLLLSQTLERVGIPIERQVALGTNEAHRVLDLFASHDGFVMMFEVRESGVRLDDVFLFLSRIRYYRPDIAFYVTTRPVSPEIRHYLTSASVDASIVLIEDEQAIEAKLNGVLQHSHQTRFRDVVRELEPQTQVDVGALVYEFFFGKEQVETRAPEAEKPPVQTAVDASLVAAPPRPAEEHLPSHDTVTLETAGGEAQPTIPSGSVDQTTAAEVASEGVIYHTPLPVVELEVPVADETSLGMLADEMIDQTILEIQEVFDMGEIGDLGGTTYRPVGDEAREHAMRRVADDVAANGVVGRSDAIAALLAEINTIPSLSSALVTDDGLVVIDRLKSDPTADLMAAVATEINDQVQRSLDEFDGGRAERIRVESAADRLHLQPAGAQSLLVVREERAPRENEEEFAGALPGEMVLREAMLKKVLEDLSLIEGVRGGIVSSRDGLAIDYVLQDEAVPADVLAAVLSLIVVDNERLCRKINLSPIRQISFRTDSCLYSLIPLDKEGILITMLDPGSPREVWQNRLYAAANMLTSVFQ